jgi:hypothetical protein
MRLSTHYNENIEVICYDNLKQHNLMVKYIYNRFMTFENKPMTRFGLVWFIVFNGHFQQYFSYIVTVSFIGGAPGENHQPAASH